MDNQKSTLELGTKPVWPLLMQYAIPAIIAMTAASLYNMVDSIFIGQGVGPLAISGLAITFPFINLTAAFGAAVGVGSSTLISVKLGQKDYQYAQRILGNTITLNIIIGILVGGLCLLFLDPILLFFGASENTISYARDYMEIILAANVFSHMYYGFNALLRATGKPKQAMYATIFTVILNAILDPLFIFYFEMGIKGAAYATILSQVVALIWQIRQFSNKKELIHFKSGTYKLQYSLVKNIISIGSAPFAMNVCACIIVIFINNGLLKYGGDLAVGSYGIANKIEFIFLMISMGIDQGMQPIAGYNYGSKQYDRLFKVVKLSIYAATVVMTLGFIVGMFFPYECARLFTSDPELIAMSIRGIRINMCVFPVIGYQMVITTFFMSIGKAKISMFLSLSRQLTFLLPLLIILPRYFKSDGVWAALPASDLLSAVVTAVIMAVFMKKFNKQNKQSQSYEQ